MTDSTNIASLLQTQTAQIIQHVDAVVEPVENRLGQIESHLRILNGRVGTGETAIGRQDERLKSVERELQSRPKIGDAERRQVIRPAESRAVTKRDVMLVSGTLTTIGAVLWWLHDMGLLHFAVTAVKP